MKESRIYKKPGFAVSSCQILSDNRMQRTTIEQKCQNTSDFVLVPATALSFQLGNNLKGCTIDFRYISQLSILA